MGDGQDIFAAMKLKIERADKHLIELRDLVQSFHESGVYEVAPKVAADGVSWLTVKRVKDAPHIVAIVVGEIVYQLRSTLDHLVCALARLHSGSDKNVYFPFATSEDEFRLPATQRKISKLSPAARSFIQRLQPYKGGNDFLWSLNRIGNLDKHTSSISVQTVGFHATADGVLRTGDCANFLQFRQAPGLFTVDPSSQSLDIALPTFPVHALDEEIEVLGVSPGSSLKCEVNVSFKVAFGEVDVVKGEPVFTTMQQYFQLVRAICIGAETI